ncbi:uroporphyrin-III C-methyltransferase [Chelatococcus sambhunathii]|uniref:Uroporphyrin-III C-methyltransferase n=1 Tax=Chelatococcus sambhunathii TaxID=363953 RepID=A0ABP2A5Z2_9HYPH|nr:siroheme synthase CysG [Chelatococcus sambhunathii]CUA89364.1 uroporphyrin-III C-methyltransferase [Chelatococcus sambhunathii]
MRIVSRQPSERAPGERAPARIAPLSVLPVFLDLAGKRAIVAGGGDAAAWKTELLVAAGAEVHVYAPREELSGEFSRLLATADLPGRLVHHDARWEAAAFSGAAVAVADAEGDAEAAAFRAASLGAGVPCNVIDKPAFCTFQFGTIVNRSPLVVGISTSGAAPVLGQAVRRRIEALLPAWLADWARLAADMRERVMARLGPGARRRAFWEAFVDRAFRAAPGGDDAGALEAEAGRIARGERHGCGHVTFVGAGPGDAELLTIKAVRALQAADVILFDDLVSEDVLELARREAKRILVGKRGGRPSCRQDEINAMMLTLARAGKHVVRLKSGDPMIFGRAGEEIDSLRREGIAFDVVPGITAGIAMAAALGVSLTHRDHAKSVRFVTGHSRHGGLPEDVDWHAIADPSATTVFYMGGRTAAQIAARLMDHRMAADTPVAIAEALGRPEEVLSRCRLADLPARMAERDERQPLVIGIGAVFAEARTAALGEDRPAVASAG